MIPNMFIENIFESLYLSLYLIMLERESHRNTTPIFSNPIVKKKLNKLVDIRNDK